MNPEIKSESKFKITKDKLIAKHLPTLSKIFRLRFIKKIFKFAFFFLIIIAALFVVDDYLYQYYDCSLFDGCYYDDYYSNSDSSDCNVLGIELFGDLVTYAEDSEFKQTASEDIVFTLAEAENDKATKAVLLEIDSYGGYPVAAEEVALALKRLNKPSVALIREGGVSAAYWAATGADVIFASKNSDVGGIGATMSYLDYSLQNQRDGLTYNSLSSGKFKDTGNQDKPLSLEEKNLLMRDVNILHQNFIETIVENRNLDLQQVEKIADGSTMLGQMALENNLIDYIGGINEVEEYFKDLIGEDVSICW
ncbi:MAG: S49 family peptidase [Patescibacteria group bacterium]|nr:S49 family peptidase [Patescibacteria group bacterium]